MSPRTGSAASKRQKQPLKGRSLPWSLPGAQRPACGVSCSCLGNQEAPPPFCFWDYTSELLIGSRSPPMSVWVSSTSRLLDGLCWHQLHGSAAPVSFFASSLLHLLHSSHPQHQLCAQAEPGLTLVLSSDVPAASALTSLSSPGWSPHYHCHSTRPTPPSHRPPALAPVWRVLSVPAFLVRLEAHLFLYTIK